eukprot:m.105869 g.105869  ORF g.105869 m.105869 type:complete len:70 (+) comp9140_c1_seq1:939-1148(+)
MALEKIEKAPKHLPVLSVSSWKLQRNIVLTMKTENMFSTHYYIHHYPSGSTSQQDQPTPTFKQATTNIA